MYVISGVNKATTKKRIKITGTKNCVYKFIAHAFV